MMRWRFSVALLFAIVGLVNAAGGRLEEKTLHLLGESELGSANYTPRHLAGYFKVKDFP